MSREHIFGWDRPKAVHELMNEDEIRSFTVSGDVFCDKDSVSLSSAAWTVVFGNISVGASSESGNKTTVAVTASQGGRSQFKVTLTFDDGQKGVMYFNVNVESQEDYVERYFHHG